MEEDEGGGGGWIVSFADLMTLLFALFVVLYGLKEEGSKTANESMVVAIREAFQEIPDEIPDDSRENPLVAGKVIFKHFKADTALPPRVKKFRRAQNPINIINEDMSRLRAKMSPASQNLRDTAKSRQDLNQIMQFKLEKDGFRIRLMSSSWYDSGQYRVKREYLPVLSKLAEMLKPLNRRLVVEGHTDDTPVSGDMSNWELSALRATYVLRYFVSEKGFPANRIVAGGAGDTKPILPNISSLNRKMNRRVEIKVHYDDLEGAP
jgi:chemotaxis protein MotB